MIDRHVAAMVSLAEGGSSLSEPLTLEARAKLLSDVLLLPGVKIVLMQISHPDSHPSASARERRVIAQVHAKVCAAFELLEKDAS